LGRRGVRNRLRHPPTSQVEPFSLSFASACDILDVPFLIVRQVHGVDFEHLNIVPAENPNVWRELGRDLAKLPEGVVNLDSPDWEVLYRLKDPHPLIHERARQGCISSLEARWRRANNT
jgi:hypothetical protein